MRVEQNDDEATISPLPSFSSPSSLPWVFCFQFPAKDFLLFFAFAFSGLISPLCEGREEGFTDTARIHRRPNRRFKLLANLSARAFLAVSACGDRTHLGRDGETRRKPTTDEDGFSGRSPPSLRPSAQCSFPRTVSTPTTLGGYRVLWGLFMEGQSVLAYVRVRWGERRGGKK